MTNFSNNITKILIISILVLIAGYAFGEYRYNQGYKKGYALGYDKGYSEGYQERNRLAEKEIADAVSQNVKTETKIVYEKIPYTGTDVQVKTEPPKVSISVNGKKQEIKQKTETADLAVKTETAVAIKIPERKWSIGIGTDGHKATYFLKAPVKNAVGVWVAGNRDKVMGGLSFSF